MDKRTELIDKAQEYWNQTHVGVDSVVEMLADFALSLETKDEWPQVNDEYWYLDGEGVGDCRWDDCGLDDDRYKRGIYRTEAEADRVDRQRIARTAIHRWIEEKAEKVDWSETNRKKVSPAWDVDKQSWSQNNGWIYQVPGWFYVYEKDYDRLMAENKQHFDVLAEGL